MDAFFYVIMTAFIFIEWVYARRIGQAVDLRQMASNLACTGLIIGFQPLTEQSYMPSLEWAAQNPITFAQNFPFIAQLVLGLLILDFTVYLLHRAQHATPILWWMHETHHQATEMNLSVGFRQSFFSFFIIWLAIVPLLFLGFSQDVIILSLFIHRFYDMLMHTHKAVGFGMLEWIFVSPRLHRVHHGYESQYINKNFANVFIIFDRLLGTFQPSGAHNISIGLNNKKGPIYNPFWASMEPLKSLLKTRKFNQLFFFSKK